jgi:hypothetical protein
LPSVIIAIISPPTLIPARAASGPLRPSDAAWEWDLPNAAFSEKGSLGPAIQALGGL